MGVRDKTTLSSGQRIGVYEIRRLLGRGAMASVYECRHVALGRLVAIKLLHPHLADEKVVAARFLREGRALSRIIHPNVVEVFDIGVHEGVPYLVMSLVQGEDLGDFLRTQGPMPMPDIADCILPIIGALAFAHEAGIVHRDLKPSNIRLTRDHRGGLVPKMLDFGISKLNEQEPELTDTGGMLGTAAYMPPEQLRSAKHADARSDVYALGVVLYECATGRRPFQGENTYDLMHAIVTAPVQPPSCLCPEIPAAFDAIVLRALQRNPSHRFAAARELGHALASFASDPAYWLTEFAPSVCDSPVERTSSRVASSLAPLTLFSASAHEQRARPYRAAMNVVGTAAFAALVTALVISGGRHRSPAAPSWTVAPMPPVHVAPAANLDGSDASGRAQEAPQRADQAEAHVSARVPENKVVQKRPRASRSAPVAAASRSETATPWDIGTNGAPILE